MEINKKIITLSLFLVIAIVLMTVMTSAAVTLNSPLAGSNNSGTINVNCTLSSILAVKNVSLYYNASGGVTTSVLTTIVNDSVNDAYFYSSVSVSALSDAATYNMTCLANNGTTQTYSAGVKSITIDNTNPTVTSTIGGKAYSGSKVEQFGTLAVTGSCSDAIDSSVTTARTFFKGNTGQTVSVSTTPYTLSSGQLDVIGTNTWRVTCTDDSGNTATTDLTLVIDSSEEQVSTITTTATKTSNNGLLVIVGIAVIVVIIGAVFILTLDKKKRR